MQITKEGFADMASQIVQKNVIHNQEGEVILFNGLTTTKLRGIYGLITNIYTQINEPADFEGKKSDIQYLKVKMAYEAGRDSKPNKPSPVKTFIEETELMELLKTVNSYESFMLYCRYAESLVAYFKFYGGKDN